MLFVSIYATAQETEFTFNNERGMTDFIVTPVEGKTAPEIYKKVIEWIKVTYKNPDKVLLSTIENDYIRIEGASDSFYSISSMLGRQYLNTKYQIEISVKDGRYKFDIISMQCYSNPSQYSAGGWSENALFNGNMNSDALKNIYKKDGTLRSLWKYLPDVPAYFNDLNKSLRDYIISNIKKNDGW